MATTTAGGGTLLEDEDAVSEPAPESQTVLCASLTCFLCGRSAGAVEAPMVGPWPTVVRFRPTGSATVQLTDRRHVRCAGCGGATFLDDIETVRQRVERIDWSLDAPRRGRPPGWLIELRRRNHA
jgi:hypothetical protein